MGALLGGLTGTEDDKLTARQLASLPMRLGGLGLKCSTDGTRSVLVFIGRRPSDGS